MTSFSGSGIERRRRVLNEQVMASGEADETPAAGKASRGANAAGGQRPPSYPPDVLRRLPRLSDFVAQRYGTLACWALLGVLAIAVLETAYAFLPEIARYVPASRLAPLDVAAAGSLATWLSSLLLALAGAGSLAIYGLRRHKADDYQGRYRLWISAALCWFALSANATAGLHHLAGTLGPQLTGRGPWADGALWWLVPGGLAIGFVLLRVAFELRPCRSALAALLLAAGCWIAAVTVSLGWPPLAQAALATLIESGTALAGHLLLLVALGLFARHVVLEAQGLIVVAPRQPKPARKQAQRSKPKASTPSADEADKAPPPARARRAKTGPASVEESATEPAARRGENSSKKSAASEPELSAWTDGSDGGDDEFDEQPDRKLSKAERRRLRKLRTQQSRAA